MQRGEDSLRNYGVKIIAEITQRDVIRRFLAALGLPIEAPRVERARPPPQIGFDWDDGPVEPPPDDHVDDVTFGDP